MAKPKVAKKVSTEKVADQRKKKYIPKNALRPKMMVQRITNPAIRRLARRGCCVRLGLSIYDDVRRDLSRILNDLMNAIVLYTVSAGRRKIVYTDVKAACKQIYGYDIC